MTNVRSKMQPWKLDAARRMRKAPTPAEAELWRDLRCRRCLGLKFNRQARLFGYIADFYCPELKVVVEVDGGYHRQPHQIAHDQTRDARLTREGLTVVRVTNAQVLGGSAYKVLLKALCGLLELARGHNTTRPIDRLPAHTP